jgi:methylglyoxal synthase
MGGDQQIGAMIAEGRVSVLIFFADPLTPMPHDVDVKALLRLVLVYDVPCAMSAATADLLAASGLFETEPAGPA